MLKFIHVVGTRPNFMKLAPLLNAMEDDFISKVIHTGQHYDKNMSSIFFEDLGINEPDFHFILGDGGHGYKTGHSLIKIEEILLDEKPDGVIVYGDVDSTLAGALAATKLHIPVIHVESGSRSYSKDMPEEKNRVMVDHISNILLGCDYVSENNLKLEGITDNVHVVGNTAIDTFHNIITQVKNDSNPIDGEFILMTLHRPSNVDDIDRLTSIIKEIGTLNTNVIFPAHPRVKNLIDKNNIELPRNIEIIEPLGYKDFTRYLYHASKVISDSGGIQCECAILRKSLITLRVSTEHTLSVDLGSNTLCHNPTNIKNIVETSIDLSYDLPYIWDGSASNRITKIIKDYYKVL